MKIGLIGAGRLGICLALLIEQEGYHVIASDMREDYIKDLQNKKINTTEPQVEEILEHSLNLSQSPGFVVQPTTKDLPVVSDF